MSRSANQTRLWAGRQGVEDRAHIAPQPCAGDLVTIKPVVDAQPQTRNLPRYRAAHRPAPARE